MDATLPRDIDLPGGDRLEVREVRPDDAPALEVLFRGLDTQARRRRFFTAAGPPADYSDRLSRIAERGGVGIVVIDRSDPEVETPGIVAEADAEPLSGSNAEMGITVDERWRGWLGPYLLSLLRRCAAERGIANLEAEFLTGNGPMRALARGCGDAILPQPGWETIRVVFGSEGTTPTWRGTTGPTVLVELRTSGAGALAGLVEAGYEVLACTGRTRGGPPCPMLAEDGDCPIARYADVVVVAVPERAERDRLMELHHRRHPDVPVVAVDVGPGHPMTSALLTAAVEAGLADGRSRRG